jgi:hypothetical protein
MVLEAGAGGANEALEEVPSSHDPVHARGEPRRKTMRHWITSFLLLLTTSM